MVQLNNIRSLTDFLRNSKAHIKRLEKTRQPEVLTVNGEARVVVQDAESYQKLVDAAELSQSVDVLRKRIATADGGAEGAPADVVLAKVRKALGM